RSNHIADGETQAACARARQIINAAKASRSLRVSAWNSWNLRQVLGSGCANARDRFCASPMARSSVFRDVGEVARCMSQLYTTPVDLSSPQFSTGLTNG